MVKILNLLHLPFVKPIGKGYNAQNVRLETIYGGQFTLSTRLIKLNYLFNFPQLPSTTVSLENRSLYPP